MDILKKYTKRIIIASAVFAPVFALAAGTDIGTLDFKGLIDYVITSIIKPITVLLLALAVVYFLWNIAEVIRAGEKGKELAELKTKALWGVIALFVMISLWGLVQILVNTFVPGEGISTFDTTTSDSTLLFSGAYCSGDSQCVSGSCYDAICE